MAVKTETRLDFLNRMRAKWAHARDARLARAAALERLRDSHAPAQLDFQHPDHVVLSEHDYARTWYIAAWPEHINPQLLFDLYTGQRVECDLHLSFSIEPKTGSVISRQLANQATGIRAKQWLRASRNLDPSPLDEERLHQIDTERRLLDARGDPFFEVTLTLTLFAASLDALNAQSQELEEMCRGSGLEIRRALGGQDRGLESVLPLNSGALRDYRRNMRKLALRNMFPFVGGELVLPNGLFFGIDTHSLAPVSFDPFRLAAPHMVIMGASGSGKSVLMKDLIEQFVLDGARCFVTDIEGEYKHLCDDLGGVYLDLSINASETINVLDLDPADEDGIEGGFSNFKGWLVSAIGRGLSAEEEMTLAAAHTQVYAERGFDERRPETLRNTAPLLSDLYGAIEALPLERAPDPVARQHLLAAMHRFAVGGLARAFSRATTFNQRGAPLIVFGMSAVPQELKRVRLRQVQQYAWSQHLDKRQRTIEFIDEAWHLLGQPETARDLADRVVRLRKYNGAAVLATQQVEDFLRNDQARRVIGQAAVQFVLKQRESSIAAIEELHKLTQEEKDALRLFRVGEFMMIAGGYRSIVVKNVPPERLALYDTRPDAPAPKQAGAM